MHRSSRKDPLWNGNLPLCGVVLGPFRQRLLTAQAMFLRGFVDFSGAQVPGGCGSHINYRNDMLAQLASFPAHHACSRPESLCSRHSENPHLPIRNSPPPTHSSLQQSDPCGFSLVPRRSQSSCYLGRFGGCLASIYRHPNPRNRPK